MLLCIFDAKKGFKKKSLNKFSLAADLLKILESLQEENINLFHFLLLPTYFFFLVKEKTRRKYIVSPKLKQRFILMINEKPFADFIIIWVLIFSFGGFSSYKMCMIRKLHKNSNITVNVRFSLFGKNGCTHAMLQTKNTILISVTF